MKAILIVLSAAVVAGLGTYVAFDCEHQFRLSGDNVNMHVDTFIALIACLSFADAKQEMVRRGLL